MRVFSGPAELRAAVGEAIGASDWLTVDQPRIDRFAEATGDSQWIHVDPERAAAGPFGAPVAHGFLTLSLLSHLVQQVYRLEGARMGVNYGLNKVRFTAPVPVGSKVRAAVALADVTEIAGGVQAVWRVTIEVDGSEKPACVAEWVTRAYL